VILKFRKNKIIEIRKRVATVQMNSTFLQLTNFEEEIFANTLKEEIFAEETFAFSRIFGKSRKFDPAKGFKSSHL